MKLTADLANSIAQIAQVSVPSNDFINGAILTKQQCNNIEFIAGRLFATVQFSDIVIALMEIIGREDKCKGFNT